MRRRLILGVFVFISLILIFSVESKNHHGRKHGNIEAERLDKSHNDQKLIQALKNHEQHEFKNNKHGRRLKGTTSKKRLGSSNLLTLNSQSIEGLSETKSSPPRKKPHKSKSRLPLTVKGQKNRSQSQMEMLSIAAASKSGLLIP